MITASYWKTTTLWYSVFLWYIISFHINKNRIFFFYQMTWIALFGNDWSFQNYCDWWFGGKTPPIREPLYRTRCHIRLPYCTVHILQCDYCACTHCNIDAETIYCSALLKLHFLSSWCDLSVSWQPWRAWWPAWPTTPEPVDPSR